MPWSERHFGYWKLEDTCSAEDGTCPEPVVAVVAIPPAPDGDASAWQVCHEHALAIQRSFADRGFPDTLCASNRPHLPEGRAVLAAR